MASSFNPEAPILLYDLRAHANPGRRNDRFWFCWPAWAFQVVAPANPHRQINVLQRTVLGLLRSSHLTASEIAERLAIDQELAAFVVIELQGQGYVEEGPHWGVTQRGLRQLRGEEEASTDLEVGWVFQNPWTRELWPFIAPGLEQASTTQRGEYRQLNLGSTGSPWDQRIWIQQTSRGYRSPDAREILSASRRHRQLRRRSERQRRQGSYWVDAEEEREVPIPDGLDIRRLTTIREEPESVFLTSYLYVPKVTDEMDVDWHACDFFGHGSNPTLRRQLIMRAEEFPPLSNALSNWIGRAHYYDGFEGFREHQRQIRERAKGLLVQCMSVQVETCPERERLRRVFEALCEVELLGEQANSARRESVLLECRKTLERSFRELAKRYPLDGVWEDMSGDRDLDAVLLQRISEELGIEAIPESFQRVKQYQVRAVSDYDDAWRLRALIVATMLAARRDPEHPLHRVAIEAPDLLDTLDGIASAAGRASHDNDHSPLTFEDLREVVDDLVRILCVFHQLSYQPVLDLNYE